MIIPGYMKLLKLIFRNILKIIRQKMWFVAFVAILNLNNNSPQTTFTVEALLLT